MGVVGFYQEEFVGEGVGGRKFVPMGCGANRERPSDRPKGEKAGDLGAGESRHVLEVSPNQAAVFLSKRPVTEAFEGFGDPGVFVLAGQSFEGQAGNRSEGFPHLF